MFAILLTLAGLLAVHPADAGFTLDFETLSGARLPADWKLDGWGYEEGYRAAVSSEAPFGGRYCLQLRFEGQTEPAGGGLLYKRFDATPYRGKRVALRATVRVLDAGCTARLMLRGSTKSGASSLVAGHVHEPIRSSDWQRFEVVGDVGASIHELEVGFQHRGRGRVLMDDIELAVVGDLPDLELLPPSTLDEARTKNLAVLGRLVGYLRYYHPSDQVAEADWGALTRAGVLVVEDADGTIELSARLEAHFASVAPTLRVYAQGRQPNKRSPWTDQPKGDGEHSIVRWEHRGLGGSSAAGFVSERVRHPFDGRFPRGFSKPEWPKDYDLGSYVIARIPTALYADAEGTLPHTETILAEGAVPIEAVAGFSGGDRATRIATVMMAWNAIQHFSPLIDEAKVDWYPALYEAIASASKAGDELAFLATLRHMVAKLGDGQARVDHRCDWRESNIPIRWDWVDGQLVVTHVATDERAQIGLGRGDVVLQISGDSAKEVFDAESRAFSGATAQRISTQTLLSMLRREREELVKMRINSAKGKKIDVSYKDKFARAPMREPRPAQFAEVESGIRYVDLSMVREVHVAEMLANLAGAKGVVFDLRDGLHDLSYRTVLAHLAPGPVDDVEWGIPLSTRPDREKLDWEELDEKIVPLEPRVDAAVAFLVDGSVVGEAEALVAVARAAGIGTIVGRPTGGTIGMTTAIELPGEYRLEWTAVRAKPPGKLQVYGQGVAPDATVERTLEGVKEGVDETLAKAVELLR